jgi:hypothetical protein
MQDGFSHWKLLVYVVSEFQFLQGLLECFHFVDSAFSNMEDIQIIEHSFYFLV